jgi:hypothetical protein
MYRVNYHMPDVQYLRESIFTTFCRGATVASGLRPPHYWGFAITIRHITLGRTPLGQWSSQSIDLYLTTHNTPKRQTGSHAFSGIRSHNLSKRAAADHALDRAILYNISSRIFVFSILTCTYIHYNSKMFRSNESSSGMWSLLSTGVDQGIV